MSQKVFWSYLLGAQSLSVADDFSAQDVIESMGACDDDTDLVLSAVRVKLQNILLGRESVSELISFVDQIAASRGGEVSSELHNETMLEEINHMRTLLNQPAMGMAA